MDVQKFIESRVINCRKLGDVRIALHGIVNPAFRNKRICNNFELSWKVSGFDLQYVGLSLDRDRLSESQASIRYGTWIDCVARALKYHGFAFAVIGLVVEIFLPKENSLVLQV